MVVEEHMNWKLALPFCVSPLTLVATTLAAVKPSKVLIQFVVGNALILSKNSIPLN